MAALLFAAAALAAPSTGVAESGDGGVESIGTVREPIVVRFATPNADQIIRGEAGTLKLFTEQLAADLSAQAMTNPGRVVALQLLNAPLSFRGLTEGQRELATTMFSGNPAAEYESRLADVLESLLGTVASTNPETAWSVYGLPLESGSSGDQSVAATNERFADTMARMDAFVTSRSFIVFDSSRAAIDTARSGLSEALRLNDGRPVLFRSNGKWQTFQRGDAEAALAGALERRRAEQEEKRKDDSTSSLADGRSAESSNASGAERDESTPETIVPNAPPVSNEILASPDPIGAGNDSAGGGGRSGAATAGAGIDRSGGNISGNAPPRAHSGGQPPRDVVPTLDPGTPTGPALPSNLSAAEAGDGVVMLNWVDNTGQNDVYYIERNPAFAGGAITKIEAASNSFVDDEVEPGIYQYRIAGLNNNGQSPFSPWVSVTIIADDGGPIGPVGGFVDAPSQYTIGSTQDLLFELGTGAPDDVDNVVFQVWSGGSEEIEAVVVDFAAPFVYPGTYLDQVTPGYGSVQALVRGPENEILDIVAVDVTFVEEAPQFPAAPGNPSVTDIGGGSVRVQWSDNSNDETGFQIERDPAMAGGYATVGTGVTQFTQQTGNGTFAYRIRAINDAGASSFTSWVSVTVNSAPSVPAAPSNPYAQDNGNGWASFSWTSNSTNHTGFEIERNPAFAGGGTINVGANFTTYTQQTGNGTFAYRARAVNDQGHSAFTPWATVSIISAPTPPAAPSNLQAMNNSDGSASLTWSNNADNQTGFEIQRNPAFAGGSTISVAGNVTSYTDQSGEGTFAYRVRATNAAGNSLYTSWATANVTIDEPDDENDDFWTEFTPSSDTRIIYVSASDGVDTSLYHYHTVGDEEIGGDPFNPVGEVYAYRSLSVAISKLRDGYPDWLLLKRGDTWENQNFGAWNKSGRDVDEPMLVATYGPNAQRARIHTGDSAGLVCWGNPIVRYLAFVGLEFDAHTRSGDSQTTGILWFGQSEHVLFEDCKVQRYYNNVSMQCSSAQINNISFRRCIIVDSFTTGAGHSQGMYFAGIHDLLIEECVIDHNGWSESIPGAGPTIFRHNSYVHHNCGPATFRGNIVARAASTGIGARSGGLVEHNLVMRNPVNLGIGHGGINWPSEAVSGIARYNVILDSADINDHNVGWGINLAKVSSAEVYGNVVAHQTTAVGGQAISTEMEFNNVTVRDNIVHNWRGSQPNENWVKALAFYGTPGGTNVVRNNKLQQALNGRLVEHTVGFDTFEYENNAYYSNSSPSVWFNHGNNGLPGWITASGEQGATGMQMAFPDPGRTVETYMQSLGESPTLEAFLEQARLQSRHFWRPQYTAQAVNEYVREGFGLEIDDQE